MTRYVKGKKAKKIHEYNYYSHKHKSQTQMHGGHKDTTHH